MIGWRSCLFDSDLGPRDDEGEHVKTMAACQDGSVASQLRFRRENMTRRL
jgi:hypothetical protein